MRTLVSPSTVETELDRILTARGVRRIARFAPGPGGGRSSTFPQLLETLEDRIPGLRTIAVAGCGGSAAPPRIAEGLATAAAREGRRTVIVDTDLHEPRQHVLWNGPDAAVGPGVRQILEDGLPASPDAFHPTRLPNTRLVPAGDPGLRDANELLMGRVLERWLQVHLPAMAEMVVVSAPRIEEPSSPAVARHADALVIVLDPDRIDGVALEGALERLAAEGVVVAGVVVVPTGTESPAAPPVPSPLPALVDLLDTKPTGDAGMLDKDQTMNVEPNHPESGNDSDDRVDARSNGARPAPGVDDLSDLLGNWRRRDYSVVDVRARGVSEPVERPVAEPTWNPLPTEVPAALESETEVVDAMPVDVAEAIARIDAAEDALLDPSVHAVSAHSVDELPIRTFGVAAAPAVPTAPEPTPPAPDPVPTFSAPPVEPPAPVAPPAMVVPPAPVVPVAITPTATPAHGTVSTALPASFEWAAGEPGRVALRVEVGIPGIAGHVVPVVAELSVAADRLRGMKGTCPGAKVVLDADVAVGGDDSRLRLWTGEDRTVALDVAFEAGSGFRFQSGSGADAPRVSFEAGADGRSVFRAVSTLLQAELSRTPGTDGGNAIWSFQLTLARAE